MNENEQIAFLTILREKLENDVDMERDEQWRRWKEMDNMILREIQKIERERETMSSNILIGGK